MSKLVFVIEDDPRSRKLACDVVLSMQLEVMAAENAEEGLSIIQDHLPDLILMDIRLPGMSGEDAFQILHENSRTCDIPVVAVTASTIAIEKDQLIAQGFTSFISKPYRYIELVAAIEQALASENQ